jgi:hypothetical protein
MSAYSYSLQVLHRVLSVANRCTKARRASLYYFYVGMSYTRIVPVEEKDYQDSLTTLLLGFPASE